MAKPIAPANGIAFAYPDVCKTGSANTPIPYSNVAQLADATGTTNGQDCKLVLGQDEDYALLHGSLIERTTGDEAGTGGGVANGGKGPGGKCEIIEASNSVVYGAESKGLARFMEKTEHNDGNAPGQVLSSFPSIVVGD